MYGVDGQDIGTLKAGADLSTKIMLFGKIAADGDVEVCGAGEKADGVIYSNPAADGRAVRLRASGFAEVIFGAALDEQDPVTPDATGKAVKAVGTQAVAGHVVKAAGSGETGLILLAPGLSAAAGRRTYLSFAVDWGDTADGDILTGFVPGFAGRIESLKVITEKAITGSGGTVTINAEIGATNLTGGVATVTVADHGTLGTVVSASAITGNNVFAADGAISVEISAAGGTRTAGRIRVVLELSESPK
jgi:hypothetical protein